MAKHGRYPGEFRERAIRLELPHEHEHGSRWATIQSIASKMGCSAEALRKWVRQAEIDGGRSACLTTEERAPEGA